MNAGGAIDVVAWARGKYRFGINILDCSDVLLDVKCAKVPHSAGYIAGIVNLRGDLVTVLELTELLGYELRTVVAARALVRLKTGGRRTAIAADRILDIISLDADLVVPPPAHMSDAERRFVSSVASLGEDLIYILDQNEILKVGSNA